MKQNCWLRVLHFTGVPLRAWAYVNYGSAKMKPDVCTGLLQLVGLGASYAELTMDMVVPLSG